MKNRNTRNWAGPSCLKVVDSEIGGTTAMLSHCSGSCPSWIALVANDGSLFLYPSNPLNDMMKQTYRNNNQYKINHQTTNLQKWRTDLNWDHTRRLVEFKWTSGPQKTILSSDGQVRRQLLFEKKKTGAVYLFIDMISWHGFKMKKKITKITK